MGFKLPDFNDRAKAAAEARKVKLDQFKAAPPPDPELLAQRAAIRAAQETKRQERAQVAKAEREARAIETAKLKAEKDAAALKAKAEQEMTAIQRLAAQKAARDARYAARKARLR